MIKRYKPIYNKPSIMEGLRIRDLMKNAGVSNFTKGFQDERHSIMGSETRVSKLVDCKILPNGDVDFIFLSEATDKYPDDYTYQSADIDNNYELSSNEGATYTITIRIIGVLDWLSTYPEKDIIIAQDIKDILDVSDIKIDSDVPAFYWQGMAYYLQQLDGAMYDKPIQKPSFWNQDEYHGDGNALLDKITQSIINQASFFRNIMASMLTRKLKDIGKI